VLAFKANNKPLEAYLAEFPYRTPEEAVQHLHGGMELVHLIEGKLGIVYQNEEHVLNAGDSAYFDPSELHAYRGISRKPARALVIATSPVSR
jgi:quercetin dioxygenase-like cupin family protein